jgi:hypothetical protein
VRRSVTRSPNCWISRHLCASDSSRGRRFSNGRFSKR